MSALAEELAGIDLGDQRLNRRARRVLAKLGEKPTLSIPAACGGWRETRAAYRLFDHDAVTAEAVLAPHIACTVKRMGAHPRVLCIEDTSEIDYTGNTLAEVTVTALLATEPHPPAGEDPLDWLLLTNLTVDTPEQAIEKLAWYLCRWQIEIYQPWCLHIAIIQGWGRCRRWRRAHVAPSGEVRRDGRAGAPVRPRRPTPAIGGGRRARPGGPAASLCAAN
jgi:hypothetical protein